MHLSDLTQGLSMLKLSQPCFPLNPFRGLALVCSFSLCLMRSWFSRWGGEEPQPLAAAHVVALAAGDGAEALGALELVGPVHLAAELTPKGRVIHVLWSI